MRIDELGWPIADAGEPEVVRVPSDRTVVLEGGQPLGVCWHWTAGDYAPDRGHTDSIALAKSIAERPPNKDAPPSEIEAAAARGVSLVSASWNVLVDKDGALVASVPFSKGSWHVGKDGMIFGRRRWPNRTLIGIELENAGQLRAIDGRMFAWPFYENPDAPPEQRRPSGKYEVDRARAVAAKGGYFDAFPPAQVAAAERLVRACVVRFQWSRGAFLFGHRDFDFPRKQDPGPLWSDEVLPCVLDRVFGS